jgi:hypothetical protein
MHTNFGQKTYVEDVCIEGRTILEQVLGKFGGKMLICFIWLRIGDVYELL